MSAIGLRTHYRSENDLHAVRVAKGPLRSTSPEQSLTARTRRAQHVAPSLRGRVTEQGWIPAARSTCAGPHVAWPRVRVLTAFLHAQRRASDMTIDKQIYEKRRDAFGLPTRAKLGVVSTRTSNAGRTIASLSNGFEVDLDDLRTRGRTVRIGAKQSGLEPVDMADEVYVDQEAS